MLYKGGVLSSSACGTNVNHAVTMIGYGTDNKGTPYWLIRNSWGANWGENGYIRVLRSTEKGPGTCGLLQLSSQPIL
jgi:hypothetical protein